jgi:hypothetical protein
MSETRCPIADENFRRYYEACLAALNLLPDYPEFPKTAYEAPRDSDPREWK